MERKNNGTFILCTSCGIEKSQSTFYKTPNLTSFPNGVIPICKDCIIKMTDAGDVKSVYSTMKKLDKPFIALIWEGIRKKKNPIGVYIRTISSLPQYKNFTFADSVFKGHEKQKIRAEIEKELPLITGVVEMDNDVDVEVYKNSIETREKELKKKERQLEDEVRKIRESQAPTKQADVYGKRDRVALATKWGSTFSREEQDKLEDLYEGMTRSFEIETASHKDYLKKICLVSLKMEIAINRDDTDTFKKLSDAYDKLMHSAKFTAVQRSASDKAGGMNTFGEMFEYIEKNGFIPKFHTDEPKDIVDETIRNIEAFTKRLVLGDTNIATQIENQIDKLRSQVEEEELVEEDADEFFIEEIGEEDD